MPDLPTLIAVWFFGMLAVSGVLLCWFSSTLPCELLLMLRALGWHKHDEDFWPEHPEDASRAQWETWANLQVVAGVFPRRPTHIAMCPVCLSVHASWVVALVTLLVWCPPGVTAGQLWLMWTGATVTWIAPAVRFAHFKR